MDFGEILTKAWKITWKHKILWIFGILAGCSGNVSSVGDILKGDSNTYQIPQIENFVENLQGFTLILVLIGFFLFAVISTYLALTGLIGIINGASKADEMDQDAEDLHFTDLFRSCKPYYWRVIKTNILIGIVVFISILFLIIPIFLLSETSAALCIVPLLCLVVPVAWVLGIVAQQAIVAIINEDLGALNSIRRVWQIVIKEKLGGYLILSLILGIGGAIMGILISLPTILVIIPIAFGSTTGNGLSAGRVFLALYLLIIATPLSAILNAYLLTAWTLAFRRAASASLEEPTDFDGDLELLSSETPDSVG